MNYVDFYLEQLHMKEISKQAREEIIDELEAKKRDIREKYKRIREMLRSRKKIEIKDLKKQLIDKSKSEVEGDVAEKINDKILEKITGIIRFFVKKEEELDIEESIELAKIEALKEKYYKTIKFVAYGVVASLIIAYANKVYKKYMKQVKKKCQGKTGNDFKKCLKLERISGLKIKINELNRRIKECERSNNPYKCRANVHKYMIKIRDKILEYGRSIEISALEIE